MKISKVERTILLNQFRILEKVDPDGGWEASVKVFDRGFAAEYEDHLAAGDEISEEICDECAEIMEMFRSLANAGSKTRFEGFDGNNETSYLSYVRHLWETDRFTESKHDDIDGGNSHFPMLSRYRRMLAEWRGSSYPLPKAVQAKIEAAAKA
jgi:uncharacterized protein YfbU (UPF0304 family)